MPNEPFRGQRTYLDGDYSAPSGLIVFIQMDEDRAFTAFQKDALQPDIVGIGSNDVSGVLTLPTIDQFYKFTEISLVTTIDLGSYYE